MALWEVYLYDVNRQIIHVIGTSIKRIEDFMRKNELSGGWAKTEIRKIPYDLYINRNVR